MCLTGAFLWLVMRSLREILEVGELDYFATRRHPLYDLPVLRGERYNQNQIWGVSMWGTYGQVHRGF